MILATLLAAVNVVAEQNSAHLLQMLDYISVDYVQAVAEGEVVNTGEYAEMKDFSAAISDQIKSLETTAVYEKLLEESTDLRNLIAEKSGADEISTQIVMMRRLIIENYQVNVVPRRIPDINLGQSLYQENCVLCHGVNGDGKGAAIAGMDPPPTSFIDAERQNLRTLYGLYSTITLGVPGTAMTAFGLLSDDERWNLAYYVGQLASTQAPQLTEPLSEELMVLQTDLRWVTTSSPQEAYKNLGEQGRNLLLYLRENPYKAFSERPEPLAIARSALEVSLHYYQQGQIENAYDKVLSAYLDGFELVEAAVKSTSPQLVSEVEVGFADLRAAIKGRAEVTEIRRQIELLLSKIDQASNTLANRKIEGATAFTSSLIILLREGLEALLVVAALAAFLLKTGRADAMRYLHLGWLSALVAGFATWYIATHVITIGGAQREITEGVAALLAAAVLFYVGFWLHSKTPGKQWQKFIQSSIDRALSAPTLWSLSGLVFISVYRECFETILFYQALWSQTAGNGQAMVIYGFVAAVVCLLIVAGAVLRYGVRLPLREFFGATAIFLFILATIFAGKGIVALQEADMLPMTPLGFNAIEILGIYPNLQGLSIQTVMVLLAALLLLKTKLGQLRR